MQVCYFVNFRRCVFFVRHVRFEPTTFGSGGEKGSLAASGSELQLSESVQVGTAGRVHRSSRKARIRTQLVTSLLQEIEENAAKTPVENRGKTESRGIEEGVLLMTVRAVAKDLRVCTATVYSLINRGELEHVRVSNAIRVVVRSGMLG